MTSVPVVNFQAFFAQVLLLAALWFGGNLIAAIFLTHQKRHLAILASVVIAWPGGEELLFRAPLCALPTKSATIAWSAVIAIALLFAGMHWKKEPPPLPPGVRWTPIHLRWARTLSAFGLGMVAGGAAIRLHALWMCFLIHAGWNAATLLAVPRILPIPAPWATLAKA